MGNPLYIPTDMLNSVIIPMVKNRCVVLCQIRIIVVQLHYPGLSQKHSSIFVDKRQPIWVIWPWYGIMCLCLKCINRIF